MQTRWLTALALALLLSAGLPGVSQAQDSRARESLEKTLDRMDEVSRSFRDMQADIEREKVTVFINSSRIETGRMFFARGDQSRIRISLEDPAPKEFLVGDGQVHIYNPNTKVLEEIGLGEHEDKVEFMVIGFGTSREALMRQYDIAWVGVEELEGHRVSVLDLAPTDPDVARYFSAIRLWVDQTDWVPVQTRATELSGDYMIVRFSDVRLNAGLAGSVFRLNLPDDVEVVRP
jgi:outer membrane lipoprotein-sorting protein